MSTIWQKILRWMHVLQLLYRFLPMTGFCVEEQKRFKHKIKGLFEPAHSCYGLSLHWVIGLAEYRYSWIWFMWTFKTFGINFLIFLGSCVIRKLVHSSWWELEKRLCGLEVGWAEVIRQTVSFLLVCVFVGQRVGWVGIIRIKCCSTSNILVTLIFHDHLHHCEIFLARLLISFVLNKAAIAFGF